MLKRPASAADQQHMLIGLATLAALLTVPMFGGRLTALGDVRLKATWLALGALAMQILIINVIPQDAGTMHRVIHLSSYGVIAVFVIVNRHVPFLWLIALGGAHNFIAIAANDGVMPASRVGARRRGHSGDAGRVHQLDRRAGPAPAVPRRRVRDAVLAAGPQRLLDRRPADRPRRAARLPHDLRLAPGDPPRGAAGPERPAGLTQPAAISATPASASTTPAACTRRRRSPRTLRASSTVVTG